MCKTTYDIYTLSVQLVLQCIQRLADAFGTDHRRAPAMRTMNDTSHLWKMDGTEDVNVVRERSHFITPNMSLLCWEYGDMSVMRE
jgi:hypothetical protein